MKALEKHHPDISPSQRGPCSRSKSGCLLGSPTQPAKDILLQVLQIMPFDIQTHQQRSSLVLHEMVVKTWFCQTDSFLGYWGKKRHCLTPAKPQKILMHA